MNVRVLLSLCVILAILAGCTAAPDAAPAAITNNTTTTTAALPPVVKSLAVSNAVAEPGAGVEPTSSETASLDVPPGYAHMTAELKASCQSPTCGYGLLYGPEGGSSTFERTGKVTTGVKAGKYTLAARSTGPSAGMTGTITVTLT